MMQFAEPCPFCGGKAYEAGSGVGGPDNGRTWQFWLCCHACWTDGPKAKSKEGAYAAWNTRVRDGAEGGDGLSGSGASAPPRPGRRQRPNTVDAELIGLVGERA